ncbi:MAG: TonB-dependent receptor [Candidatus Electrothrix communis]|nr:MAG: TonB-dependent receptor [Candidatus Electrothrix communis]
MKQYMVYGAVLAAVITGTGNGKAELLDKVALHGFGSWAAGMTNNENRYFLWTEDGNFEHLEAGLGIQAELYETVSVYVQASFNSTWLRTEAKMDYAFAEWSLSDQLNFRGGKVNAPFMLYSELYDARTARPFFNPPLGIYNLGAEAYKGLGLTGTFTLAQDWAILYDLYGGTMVQHSNRRISYDDVDDIWHLENPDQAVENMLGGRIMVTPPLDGLRIGLSAYSGDQKYYQHDSLTEYEEEWEDETLFNTLQQPVFVGLSIEYVLDTWELRSEYLLTSQDDPGYQRNSVYAEAAYRFTEHWQAAVRYEYSTVNEFPDQGFLDDFDSLREHKELVLGLNYWFTPGLAVKCSYHLVQGNSFTGPADDDEYKARLIAGSFNEDETQLFLFGVQFSF